MRSRTLLLPEGSFPRDLLRDATRDAGRPPDLALGFLPPSDDLAATLAALAEAWPGSLRFGCEAVTQFADAGTTHQGTLQLFWFDDPRHRAEVEVIPGTYEEPPSSETLAAVAGRLSAADGALLIADGLRFPVERVLGELGSQLNGSRPLIAGGLASQGEPVTRAGARVFFQDRIHPAACLAVTLHGVRMRVEVVRGWTPASPVYTVTRAEGNVLYEIEGEPATEWYRRFFTISTEEGAELAPMPDSANRFPLIVEGPERDRQGLYRSMVAFDDPPGAVTYWGSVRTGDRVRLGMGNDASLVRTAATLHADQEEPPEAAILYSCVGREIVLGDIAPDEAAAIHRGLGGVALSGFFTFGEIGPTAGGSLAFYNQTAILVLLSEEAS